VEGDGALRVSVALCGLCSGWRLVEGDGALRVSVALCALYSGWRLVEGDEALRVSVALFSLCFGWRGVLVGSEGLGVDGQEVQEHTDPGGVVAAAPPCCALALPAAAAHLAAQCPAHAMNAQEHAQAQLAAAVSPAVASAFAAGRQLVPAVIGARTRRPSTRSPAFASCHAASSVPAALPLSALHERPAVALHLWILQ